MPSGGSTALSHEETEYIQGVLNEAREHGLEFEWLSFFVGGLWLDRKHPREAAQDAAIEWDF